VHPDRRSKKWYLWGNFCWAWEELEDGSGWCRSFSLRTTSRKGRQLSEEKSAPQRKSWLHLWTHARDEATENSLSPISLLALCATKSQLLHGDGSLVINSGRLATAAACACINKSDRSCECRIQFYATNIIRNIATNNRSRSACNDYLL